MAVRKNGLILLLLVCTAFLFSQNRQEEALAGSTQEGGSFRFERTPEGAVRIIQRLSWIRGAHDFRYDAVIEKRNERGDYSEIHRENTEENFIELSLSRGRYRYRVAVYNLLDQLEYTTAWVNFSILPAVQPKISSISPDDFALKEDASWTIEIQGENFLPETDVALVPREGGREIKPAGYTVSSTGKSARLVFEFDDLQPGDYDLWLRNAGSYEDRADFAIRDYHPSSFSVGLAYSPLILLHGYPDAYYTDSVYPLGASLRTDYICSRREWGNLGVSARLMGGRMVSPESDGGMKVSLWIAGIVADAFYEFRLSRETALRVRVGGGVVPILRMRYDFDNGVAPEPK
ncbi:MAG: hypothetical protein FWG35_07960, partial [Spirochaetaceae bacterium]|nr:hypothetical protein [Spirochaetaceae bacterium]